MILALSFSFALGLVLLWIGLRGVCVDNHPTCRKCGFDLVGTPATTLHCGECGANIVRLRAIIIGNRRRRMRPLVSGIVLVTISLTVAGVLIVSRKRHIKWVEHYPVGLLIHQALARPDTRCPELTELDARLSDGRLSLAEIGKVEDAFLDRQADERRPWNDAWGDLLVHAEQIDKIDFRRWQRYVQQAAKSLVIEFTPRALLRRGDRLAYQLTVRFPRSESQDADIDDEICFQWTITNCTIGPLGGTRMPLDLCGRGWQRAYNGTAYVYCQMAEGSYRYSSHLPPGTNTVEFTITLKFSDDHKRDLLNETRHVTAPFQVLPADRQSTTFYHDPAAAAALKNCIAIQSVIYMPWRGSTAALCLSHSTPPMPAAYDVSIRTLTGTFPIGSIVARPVIRDGLDSWVVTVPSLEPGFVDVILMPSAAEASDTVDILRMPDEPLIYPHVPLTVGGTLNSAQAATMMRGLDK